MAPSFHVLEGIDGCGKTTAMNTIRDYLTEKNVPFEIVSAFPTDEEGMRMRNIWINKQVPDPGIISIVLYLRNRVLQEQIIPALQAGKMVISDRWHDTTWAYNHYGSGVPFSLISQLFMYYDHQSTVPRNVQNLLHNYNMLYFDVPLSVSRARINNSGREKDAFESSKDDFFNRVISGYEKRIEIHQTNTCGHLARIDATGTPEEVGMHIKGHFANWLE